MRLIEERKKEGLIKKKSKQLDWENIGSNKLTSRHGHGSGEGGKASVFKI